MARSFKLPDLGEGIHEGEIIAVHVSVGDRVKEGDIIMEVETDKAAVEVPSPFTGTVTAILVKPGDVVRVGDELITFDGEEAAEEKKPEKGPPEEERPPERAARPEEKPRPEAPPERAPERRMPEERPPEGKEPVPASPATRRLARELGVDLSLVEPSGPGGRVTDDDVRRFAEEGKRERPERREEKRAEERVPEGRPIRIEVPPLPDFRRWGEIERVPVRSVRRATVKSMAVAWSQIPHVASQDNVDITRLEDFRKRHKADVEAKGGKLSMTVFALKAVAACLRAYPTFNSSLDMESGHLILKKFLHVGVAVTTNDGLIVPVVRDVDRKSIRELALELTELVQRTRDRKISLEELQGGSFTITNVGPLGGGHFAPIINYPEVAILGMGSARLEPVVKEDERGDFEIVPRLMMPIVLCIDHRVLDGSDALAFINLFKQSLQDPDELLMSMV